MKIGSREERELSNDMILNFIEITLMIVLGYFRKKLTFNL
jgi:hypothetical protein